MTRNMKRTSTGITLTVLAVALAGCAGPAQNTKTESPAAAAAAAATLSGKVVETMDAGGYTYMLLDKGGQKTWVAAPVMKVSVGDEVKMLPGAEMNHFNSKTLNRTFDKVIFSGGPVKGGESAGAQPQAAANNESAEPILAGKVVETMNAMQYTYVNIEKDGKTAWAAVPSSDVKVGDEIELQPGTAMGQFTSKSLNRTFNSIYFASGVKGKTPGAAPAEGKADAKTDAAALPSGHPKIDTPQLPAGHPKVDAAPADAAKGDAKGETKAGAKGDSQAAPRAPEPAPPVTAITGKVVETTDAAGYTYLCVEKEGKKSWIAVPTMKVKVGEEVALSPGVVMTNFVSKSLNRTFEKIVFSSGPVN